MKLTKKEHIELLFHTSILQFNPNLKGLIIKNTIPILKWSSKYFKLGFLASFAIVQSFNSNFWSDCDRLEQSTELFMVIPGGMESIFRRGAAFYRFRGVN